jgi:hypothetical protein
MRAKAVGIPVMVDTRCRLWHIGNFFYGWEDAGSEKERYKTYRFAINPPPAGQPDEPPALELFHPNWHKPVSG